ncbi:DNA polymerase delta subunit 4-like [Haliotis rufescens]|uniref:DNA polymerase delta subunit 4-like n=1 Tax=Haliotis rufescens TaxID=6454 RepID=UPI00201F3619|nr:DNA polymerase delta subunit 4-like [Haliotis rufescens]
MSSSMITDSFKQTKRIGRQVKKEDKEAGRGGVKTQQQIDLELLQQFDLTLEFGPCSGITRMERWARAEKHGLNPPPEVKDLLEQHPHDEEYTQCLWKDYSI